MEINCNLMAVVIFGIFLKPVSVRVAFIITIHEVKPVNGVQMDRILSADKDVYDYS